MLKKFAVVWYRVIIVSALSLSLRDKERLRDWEIERAWKFGLLHQLAWSIRYLKRLTVMLYKGKFMTQYRKSANARLIINMVVYFNWGRLKPRILLCWAHGTARIVSKLPMAPENATIKQLKMEKIVNSFPKN